MRRLLVLSLGPILALATSTSMAGNYRHHGYYGGNHYGGHYYGGHRHHYRYRNHRRSNDAAWLVGGLVLGSVITHAYHHNHARNHNRYYDRGYGARYHRGYPVQRQVIYRTRVIERPTEIVNPGRHLYRDINGNCYQLIRNEEGDELRQELPPEECSW